MRWEHIRTMQSITELIVPNSCQFLFGLSRLFSDLSLDFSLMFFNRYRLQPYNNFPCPYFACRCFAIIHPPDPSCPLFLPSLASVGYSSVRSSIWAMRHGINAVPREQQSSKGRISIISPLRWKTIWKSTSVVRVVLTPWLSGNECHKNTIWYCWDVH